MTYFHVYFLQLLSKNSMKLIKRVKVFEPTNGLDVDALLWASSPVCRGMSVYSAVMVSARGHDVTRRPKGKARTHTVARSHCGHNNSDGENYLQLAKMLIVQMHAPR